MSAYDDLTQGNENSASGKYDFWANVFTHFNPQAPQTQPFNSSPLYAQAANSAMAGVPSGGPSGNFHSGRVGQRLGMEDQAQADKTNYQNQMSSLWENPKEAMNYGIAGLGRMDKYGNIQKGVDQLSTDRNTDFMAQQETNANKLAQYNASKPDFFSSLLSGLGQVGGTLAGKALGGSGKSNNSPGLDEYTMPSYDQAGLDQMNALQLPSLAGTGG